MKAITKLEPIPLPDRRRPEVMPSLPAWLATQRAALAINLQSTEEGFRDLTTLPREAMPTPEQRAAIEAHLRFLNSLLEQTPERSEEAAKQAVVTLTRMMMVLGGQKASELAAEAKAEVYMEAIDDVTAWAVDAAVRRWYRGECGKDARGNAYDYRWPPDPAELRRLSLIEEQRCRLRIKQLRDVLEAQEFVDCTDKLELGRLAWLGFQKCLGDSSAMKDLTFAKAVELGRKQQQQREEAA